MITNTKLFRPLKQVAVTPRDVKRLSPHLASTGALNVMLVLDVVSTDDLQRMLIMESTGNYARDGHARYSVVRKLVARILSRERTRMVEEAFGRA
jgi:hypothetical protein